MVRTFAIYEKNDKETARKSVAECFKIIGQLLEKENNPNGKKEINIIKIIIKKNILWGETDYEIKSKDWEIYFYPFQSRLFNW